MAISIAIGVVLMNYFPEQADDPWWVLGIGLTTGALTGAAGIATAARHRRMEAARLTESRQRLNRAETALEQALRGGSDGIVTAYALRAAGQLIAREHMDIADLEAAEEGPLARTDSAPPIADRRCRSPRWRCRNCGRPRMRG